LIRNATLIDMYRFLKARSDGFRSTPGTAMSSLEAFINDDEICRLDPLIKMALIHHQFESIHPFADGNGRNGNGRILNVLYLTKTGLLEIPILYCEAADAQTRGINTTSPCPLGQCAAAWPEF
jgi:hypothetical protein